jgi:transcriptional regulator with XRE-family HTH domain
MPRRPKPDPYAVLVGGRIRRLRQDLGMTMEKLAYESELGSKGHLSNIERGLVVITVKTLKTIAEGLGVHPADLLLSPDGGWREALVDASRRVPVETLRRWVREAHQSPQPGLTRRSS